MSVSYFRIVPPITHIQQGEYDDYACLRFYYAEGPTMMSAGVLYVPQKHAPTILKLFALREDDDKCPMRTHYGGVKQGAIVTINDPNLDDKDVLISSNGELLTVKEIKAKEGEGKDLVEMREEENTP